MEKTIEILLEEQRKTLEKNMEDEVTCLRDQFYQIASLKPLAATSGLLGVLIPEWIDGQKEYLVSTELLKSLIEEINDSRRLVGGINAIRTYLRDTK